MAGVVSTDGVFDVFISLRFSEARNAGRALERALEERGIKTFLCDVAPGDDIASAVIRALHGCRMAVILGTRTYGKRTATKFSTFEELRYIVNRSKPFFLVKMCDDFAEPEAQFRLSEDISYFPWTPDEGAPHVEVPAALVDEIVAKLKTIPETAAPADAAPFERGRHGYGALPPPNVPVMSREAAEAILLDRDDAMPGDYLVRRKKKRNTAVIVSLVAHPGVVEHHVLERGLDGSYVVNGTRPAKACGTLSAMLEHLSTNRESMTRTLQCRVVETQSQQQRQAGEERGTTPEVVYDVGRADEAEDHAGPDACIGVARAERLHQQQQPWNPEQKYEEIAGGHDDQVYACPDAAGFGVYGTMSGDVGDDTDAGVDDAAFLRSGRPSSGSLSMRAAPAGIKAFSMEVADDAVVTKRGCGWKRILVALAVAVVVGVAVAVPLAVLGMGGSSATLDCGDLKSRAQFASAKLRQAAAVVNCCCDEFYNLESVTGSVALNSTLTSLQFGSVQKVVGIINVDGDTLAAIDFGGLTSVSGFMQITDTAVLTSIDFGSLASVERHVTIYNNDALTSIDFGNITSVGGYISFSGNYALTSIDFGNISGVGGILVRASRALTNIDFGSITSAGGGHIDISENDALTSINFGSLTSVEGYVAIYSNDVLTSIDFGSITSVGVDVNVRSNRALANIDFGSITSVGGFIDIRYTSVTSLDCKGVGTCIRYDAGVSLHNCPSPC
ncbi:hypothetical protein PTSG_02597 [Salpingoeca rosetta]|uniref:Uncharacterized protein n=1 Tax=Salpingoeca rosetta (strain ATCC 50818 / BSB-021) TaxID=946362 RepID=F2U2R8_SALR5|nr:uncharacterized protein PTSG_02597 [Salpingoeca rosetta]EGD81912.1 hypothetical protein PTSG_02597 [Salpingoeca rosetta]|eukprot:XP_004996095.1 hypothetical protein PTSG_02597 [Salpingoeca rosetta]